MKDKKQIMLDELSKEPEMVIVTAYLYATHYVDYGIDITKAWITAIQHQMIAEKIYNRGYSDALKERGKLKKIEQIVKDHDNDSMPEDYWYIDKIREVLEKD